MLKKIYIFF